MPRLGHSAQEPPLALPEVTKSPRQADLVGTRSVTTTRSATTTRFVTQYVTARLYKAARLP